LLYAVYIFLQKISTEGTSTMSFTKVSYVLFLTKKWRFIWGTVW